MTFQTRYVIGAGIAWIRRTRVEIADGRIEDRVWAVLVLTAKSPPLPRVSQHATERGGGLSLDGVAVEFGTRTPIARWPE